METLVARSQLFPYKNKHFYLFSKTGFTSACMEKASELENVSLVTYEEMLEE